MVRCVRHWRMVAVPEVQMARMTRMAAVPAVAQVARRAAMTRVRVGGAPMNLNKPHQCEQHEAYRTRAKEDLINHCAYSNVRLTRRDSIAAQLLASRQFFAEKLGRRAPRAMRESSKSRYRANLSLKALSRRLPAK